MREITPTIWGRQNLLFNDTKTYNGAIKERTFLFKTLLEEPLQGSGATDKLNLPFRSYQLKMCRQKIPGFHRENKPQLFRYRTYKICRQKTIF